MAQSNLTKIVIRNADNIQGDKILVYDAPESEVFFLLQEKMPSSEIVLHTRDFIFYNRYIQAGVPVTNASFGTDPIGELYDTILLFLPKSDEDILMTIELCKSRLAPGGHIFVVGVNKSGIRPAGKKLQETIGPIVHEDHARHSIMYQARLEKAKGKFDFGDYRKKFSYESLKLISYPGVFSHGKVDPGTKLLLENLEIPMHGSALDIGCGYGLIGAYLASKGLDVQMVDIDAMSIKSAHETMEANGLEAKIFASDVFSDIHASFDLITCNIPFHHGLETDYTFATKLLSGAKEHLQGTLYIVANAFLPYEKIMKKYFTSPEKIVETNAYKVYRLTT